MKVEIKRAKPEESEIKRVEPGESESKRVYPGEREIKRVETGESKLARGRLPSAPDFLSLVFCPFLSFSSPSPRFLLEPFSPLKKPLRRIGERR